MCVDIDDVDKDSRPNKLGTQGVVSISMNTYDISQKGVKKVFRNRQIPRDKDEIGLSLFFDRDTEMTNSINTGCQKKKVSPSTFHVHYHISTKEVLFLPTSHEPW